MGALGDPVGSGTARDFCGNGARGWGAVERSHCAKVVAEVPRYRPGSAAARPYKYTMWACRACIDRPRRQLTQGDLLPALLIVGPQCEAPYIVVLVYSSSAGEV